MNTVRHGLEQARTPDALCDSGDARRAIALHSQPNMHPVCENLHPRHRAQFQAAPAMSGHAGTGGLQKHSVGEDYPYCVCGTQAHANAPTQWYVMDLRTGNRGYVRSTYNEAQRDITALKIRNMMHD